MRILAFLSALLLLGPIFAQEDAKTAKAALDELNAKLDAEQKDFQRKVKEIQATDAYKKAQEAQDRETTRSLIAEIERPNMEAWTQRYADAAEKFAGTEGAVPFLTWIATRSPNREQQKDAVETLTTHHAKSKGLEEVFERASMVARGAGEESFRKLADAVLEKNPSDEMKAFAHWGLASLVRGRELSDEDVARRDGHLKKISELAPESIVALRAKAPEFERTKLQMGMTAPDIEGTDLDGKPFKLSDYRGKVVVLDFWGDW